MKKILIAVVALAIVALGAYYFKPSGAAPAALPTDATIAAALRSATIDVSAFGGTAVTLADGEATFTTDPNSTTSPAGFVKIADKQATIFSGENADVFAAVHINGGGSGTFQFLLWLAYDGATQVLTEKQRIPLGDRIEITDIAVNQTAPTSFDVLVALKDRRPFEPMATAPSQSQVLHFGLSDTGLVLRDVIFGTIAEAQVVVASPLPGATTPRSFTVAGAARGPWFFEANLPIEVRNATGTVVMTVPAAAQGEWMTDALVPFSTIINLASTTEAGMYSIVVKKDNPSGLPENDGSIEFPILIQ